MIAGKDRLQFAIAARCFVEMLKVATYLPSETNKNILTYCSRHKQALDAMFTKEEHFPKLPEGDTDLQLLTDYLICRYLFSPRDTIQNIFPLCLSGPADLKLGNYSNYQHSDYT